jgi:hypothetical protein
MAESKNERTVIRQLKAEVDNMTLITKSQSQTSEIIQLAQAIRLQFAASRSGMRHQNSIASCRLAGIIRDLRSVADLAGKPV